MRMLPAQQLQDAEAGLGQDQGPAVVERALFPHQQGQWADPHLLLLVQRPAARQRFAAQGHLAQVERLGQVVVGAFAEALRLVLEGVACGQHQDRHVAGGMRLDLAAHLQAVHVGQVEVEQHHVVAVLGGQPHGQGAAAGMVKLPAQALEEIDQLAGDGRVVFDH